MDDTGVTFAGATYSSESLLNFIPAESIRSITQKGISIDRVSDIIQDVDTTMPVFVNPLRNLFEQSVAYGRANDTIEVDLADIPSAIVNRIGPNGNPINTPWTLASHIYGISFADNDTLTFYIKYSLGSARRYGVDPTVVAGLGPQWQNAPSIKLTFQGRSFDIPIGITDPQSGLLRDGGTGIGSDQDSEFAASNVDYTLGIQLIASPNKSNFDY
jgi:hypothetical protein